MKKKNDFKTTIGLRMKQIRESLSYKQEHMAEFFGVRRDSYAKREIGETYPGYRSMYRLATKLDVSLDWLICGKGPEFFKEKEAGEESKEPPQPPLNPEHRELIDYMEKFPLLHHEVMAFFYRFKRENEEMFGAVD